MSLTLKPRTQVRAKISSVGTYVPPRLLTNADLEKMVATNDQWITERTGIRERHIVDAGVATSDLAVEAAKKCLAVRGIAGSEEEGRPPCEEGRPSGVQPAGGRSGCTPAEPYPPDGEADDTRKGPYRPAANHPWRRTFLTGKKEDISNGG